VWKRRNLQEGKKNVFGGKEGGSHQNITGETFLRDEVGKSDTALQYQKEKKENPLLKKELFFWRPGGFGTDLLKAGVSEIRVQGSNMEPITRKLYFPVHSEAKLKRDEKAGFLGGDSLRENCRKGGKVSY